MSDIKWGNELKLEKEITLLKQIIEKQKEALTSIATTQYGRPTDMMNTARQCLKEVEELKKIKGTVGFITINERCDQLEQQLKERDAMIIEAREIIALLLPKIGIFYPANKENILRWLERTKDIK
jgi:HPt (histidine-containing phosphotransfer) domain-containing protein